MAFGSVTAFTPSGRPMFGEYKIVAIPTQVFLDASGKEVDRHIGALTKEEVVKKLKELKFLSH